MERRLFPYGQVLKDFMNALILFICYLTWRVPIYGMCGEHISISDWNRALITGYIPTYMSHYCRRRSYIYNTPVPQF
jgi:hypothetical protein